MHKALEVVLVLSMSFSFGMLVVAIRGPRSVRLTTSQRRNLGIAGAVLFAGGLAAWFAAGGR